ncbi:MAG: hypothetical protein VZR09_01700 [Candidatus Gastranaerophilaceae bacterium]|nr:hypothetical protein [Candidatus Gastranaerophilaceae bacterium]
MGTTLLEEKYPFLINYFKKGVENSERGIAHCILFYGTDLGAQYDLAIEIARLLNCTGDRSNECNCLNCNWIRQNQHPAVMTISKVDNKEPDDTSKTVISIDQARMIKNSLLVTSDYHRVLIFCDRDKDGNICGLNSTNFQEPTANALLKTFEEPPQGTTFFFLTKDKDDMISTIISRAQCFFVPSLKEEVRDYSLVSGVMDNYLQIQRNEVLNFYSDILNLTKDNDAEEIFNQIQNYLYALLKNSLDSPVIKIKLIKDINFVEHAKQELRLNMNIQTIVENLAYGLILE